MSNFFGNLWNELSEASPEIKRRMDNLKSYSDERLEHLYQDDRTDSKDRVAIKMLLKKRALETRNENETQEEND